MTAKSKSDRTRGNSPRIDRATFRPGDYGRLTQEDGTDQWWVRAPDGGWRVAGNDDGTITLLYLK